MRIVAVAIVAVVLATAPSRINEGPELVSEQLVPWHATEHSRLADGNVNKKIKNDRHGWNNNHPTVDIVNQLINWIIDSLTFNDEARCPSPRYVS